MQKLTSAEEEIMQHLWQLERATVTQLIDLMPDPKPPHSTISSIIRILERKEAVGHKAYGRTYEYFPLITREAYSARSLSKLATDYFDGSVRQMVSFLAQRDDLSLNDLEEIRQLLNKKNREL
jgi:predicted transcriptional regulator